MNILQALKDERDRIDAAIRALSGGSSSNGRRGRLAGAAPRGSRGGQRKLSAEARRRISEAAKARWAKAKRAGRNSL